MAEFAIQQGLFEALTGIGLTVYDVMPQLSDGGSIATYPCVTIGTIVLAPWDTKERLGFDFIARIHSYSRSTSMREGKGIQSSIYQRLHRGVIAVTGYRLVDLLRETSDVMRLADGSFHGVCEFRGLIDSTSL